MKKMLVVDGGGEKTNEACQVYFTSVKIFIITSYEVRIFYTYFILNKK